MSNLDTQQQQRLQLLLEGFFRDENIQHADKIIEAMIRASKIKADLPERRVFGRVIVTRHVSISENLRIRGLLQDFDLAVEEYQATYDALIATSDPRSQSSLQTGLERITERADYAKAQLTQNFAAKHITDSDVINTTHDLFFISEHFIPQESKGLRGLMAEDGIKTWNMRLEQLIACANQWARTTDDSQKPRLEAQVRHCEVQLADAWEKIIENLDDPRLKN